VAALLSAERAKLEEEYRNSSLPYDDAIDTLRRLMAIRMMPSRLGRLSPSGQTAETW
jgi:hypothetical protein